MFQNSNNDLYRLFSCKDISEFDDVCQGWLENGTVERLSNIEASKLKSQNLLDEKNNLIKQTYKKKKKLWNHIIIW